VPGHVGLMAGLWGFRVHVVMESHGIGSKHCIPDLESHGISDFSQNCVKLMLKSKEI